MNTPVNAPPDLTVKTIYHDGPIDRLLIAFLSTKLAGALGRKTKESGYAGFVDLSKQIMQGRNAQAQQDMVAKVLGSVVPSPVLWLIRTLSAPTQWVCESNAWFASVMFQWLVGPCDRKSVAVTGLDGQPRLQKSAVQIKKCRYLEDSGCVGLCVNLCKLPTQRFFTEGFGIPLTMVPNFEDFSCEMIFGQIPPNLQDEDCYQQPCLANHCAIATPQPCPKVRDYPTIDSPTSPGD
jgi:Beta-carotene isomerase D27-like, C-terminal